MAKLTDDILKRIMPNTTKAKRAAALPILTDVALAYDITNGRRLSGWLATLAVESGELKYQEEIASGSAYEGRADLGNTQKGDGKRFKGHGRIQVTGRANHQSYTNYLKKNQHLPFVDFVAHPERLAEEPYATDAAGWFWAVKIKANPIADKNDFLTTQVRVNGRNKKTGLPNHYNERLSYYHRGLEAFPSGFVLGKDDTQQIQDIHTSTVTKPALRADSNSADTPMDTSLPSSHTSVEVTEGGGVSVETGGTPTELEAVKVKDPERTGFLERALGGLGISGVATVVIGYFQQLSGIELSAGMVELLKTLIPLIIVLAFIAFVVWFIVASTKRYLLWKTEVDKATDPNKANLERVK